MIVRAMTSESGEMCNLEERGPDTRLSQRMSSNETQNSVSTKVDWEDLVSAPLHDWSAWAAIEGGGWWLKVANPQDPRMPVQLGSGGA